MTIPLPIIRRIPLINTNKNPGYMIYAPTIFTAGTLPPASSRSCEAPPPPPQKNKVPTPHSMTPLRSSKNVCRQANSEQRTAQHPATIILATAKNSLCEPTALHILLASISFPPCFPVAIKLYRHIATWMVAFRWGRHVRD